MGRVSRVAAAKAKRALADLSNADLDTSASSRTSAKTASSGANKSFGDHSFLKPKAPRAPATTKRTYKQARRPRAKSSPPASSSSEDDGAVEDLPHQNKRKSKMYYPGACS